jgi:hypothetical protein
MEQSMGGIFSFKSTVPATKQLNYTRPNPQHWVFEPMNESPVDYITMARRGKKGFIARKVGQNNGFASHWKLNDKEVRPLPPPSSQMMNKPVPSQVHQPVIHQCIPSVIHSPIPQHQQLLLPPPPTQHYLYTMMFEQLVGKRELERIEKSYKMRTKRQPRYNITISELIQ